jgi:hypothetical protein
MRIVGIIASLAAAAVMAVGCGGGGSPARAVSGSSETVGNAMKTVESLPSGISVRHSKAAGVLIGTGLRGPSRFQFFLIVSREIPKRLRRYAAFESDEPRLSGRPITNNYIVLAPNVQASTEVGRQQSNLIKGIEQALCRQATGTGCSL